MIVLHISFKQYFDSYYVKIRSSNHTWKYYVFLIWTIVTPFCSSITEAMPTVNLYIYS